MTTAEFRIGNYVWDDYSVETLVSQITYSTESVFLRKTWSLPDGRFSCIDIKPIPLTEEWLLKFGFKEDKIRSWFFKDCGEYRIRISVNVFFGMLEKESSWFVSILTGYGSQPVTLGKQYVHQLQNLYFALTGEELEIKTN